MITTEQINAAIAALRWYQADVAEKSGVAVRTIQRMLSVRGVPEDTTVRNVTAVVTALEAGDQYGYIEFIDNGAPGILFHKLEVSNNE